MGSRRKYDSKKKTVLNVDKDVTILGSTGIAIFYDVKHGAYNTEVNFCWNN